MLSFIKNIFNDFSNVMYIILSNVQEKIYR